MKKAVPYLLTAIVSSSVTVAFLIGLKVNAALQIDAFTAIIRPLLEEQRAEYAEWSGTSVFPANSLICVEESSRPDCEESARYASYHLAALDEGRLDDIQLKADQFAMRIIVLPSFSAPFVFRVEPEGNNYKVGLKIGEGIGGYAARPVDFESTAIWDKSRAKALIEEFPLVNVCDPKILPDIVVLEDGTKMITERADGSNWFVEYLSVDQYCAAVIWSPDAGPYTRLLRSISMRANRTEEPAWFAFMLSVETTQFP